MKQGDSRKQARRSQPQAGQRRQDSGKTKTAKISPQDVLGKNPARKTARRETGIKKNQHGMGTKKHRSSEWYWDA
jgi:hypothetical protein